MQSSAVIVDWAQGTLFFLAALAIATVTRTMLLRTMMRHWGNESAARILRDTLRLPSVLWCFFIALAVTLHFASLPERAARWAAIANVVFLVLSISLSTSTLLVRLGMYYSQSRGLPFATSGLSRALIHIVVLVMGAAVLLRYFNIGVTPLLTAVGFVGLAIALAIKDTLANFVAGIHILVEAPVSVGDFIQLSSGEEGTVVDIGWRTTRVLSVRNNIVVIPNEKITSSILTNYAMPETKMVLPIDLVTALDADVEQVRRIAVEEARRTEGVAADFEPLLLVDPGVTPTHLGLKLIVQIQNRLLQGLVASEIRQRILTRFRAEGVPLPVVTQVAALRP